MLNILFAGNPTLWPNYEPALKTAFADAGLEFELSDSCDDPAIVDYIVFSPAGPIKDFSPFVRTKAVLNLWAGVESVVGNKTLTQPLTRMVDPGLREGMVEWVTGHVLRHHLGMDVHIHGQDGVWREGKVPPLARDRCVGILGLGELGAASGQALAGLNFDVAGWSRSQKSIEGIKCFSGEEGLRDVMARSEILVLLLPLTPETTNVLNSETLALMPKGTVIINPGRGPMIDDAALLNALNNGQISHATLDVFRVEPLPVDDPYWAHPNVTVTPHIAAETRVTSSARMVAENVRRAEANEPLMNVVDRSAGY
ncbi:D-isomer specific 2-hydroxyacid dehydrogenase, NAD-binding protein [Rhodobacteraceae bacterium HTCC2150]|nr:D-isomer specific 2-hydroxyacid dehydrogenase, NAD-binding protein [Rhodobacteraceae bacterium HTCC2150]